MKKLDTKVKLLGLLNVVLIVTISIYDIIRLTQTNNAISVISILIHLGAFVFGLNYAFNVYIKAAATSYKGFMFMFALAEAFTLITTIVLGKGNLTGQIIDGFCCICLLFLTFGKDLGKKYSYCLSIGVVVTQLLKLFTILGSTVELNKAFTTYLSNLLLAFITLLFVVGKYIDKDRRNTK